MNEPQILTTVTATVPAGREGELLSGYRSLLSGDAPDGLLRSELLQAQDGRWVIQSLWRSREAIIAARKSGEPPAALVLLDSVGAQHTHEILTVQMSSAT